ncbi:MAG: Endonuclease/exonuclease/phosphatase, partial [Thermoleophilia bacterium]|nr:Endonuclease/exonuclease/phosphatase [Thermoleophilia bacterium]
RRPSGPASFRGMSAIVLYENTDVDRVLAQVQQVNPDVLLLQEYTKRWHADADARLRNSFPFVADRSVLGSDGVAVYSKLPIVGRARLLDLGDPHRLQTRAVVRVGGRDIAVYDIHLTVAVKPVGHVEQRRQVPELVKVLEHEQLPMIVAGDMNFTETSRHHAAIAGVGLRSGWDEVGRGRGSTWARRGLPEWLPGLRLDHVFLSPGITVDGMRIGARNGSDHRPIYADLRLR